MDKKLNETNRCQVITCIIVDIIRVQKSFSHICNHIFICIHIQIQRYHMYSRKRTYTVPRYSLSHCWRFLTRVLIIKILIRGAKNHSRIYICNIINISYISIVFQMMWFSRPPILSWWVISHIDILVQDCSNSIANVSSYCSLALSHQYNTNPNSAQQPLLGNQIITHSGHSYGTITQTCSKQNNLGVNHTSFKYWWRIPNVRNLITWAHINTTSYPNSKFHQSNLVYNFLHHTNSVLRLVAWLWSQRQLGGHLLTLRHISYIYINICWLSAVTPLLTHLSYWSSLALSNRWWLKWSYNFMGYTINSMHIKRFRFSMITPVVSPCYINDFSSHIHYE